MEFTVKEKKTLLVMALTFPLWVPALLLGMVVAVFWWGFKAGFLLIMEM